MIDVVGYRMVALRHSRGAGRRMIRTVRLNFIGALFCLVWVQQPLIGQEYSVLAVDSQTGKVLPGIPISLRYDCKKIGSGLKMKIRCKFIQRRTGRDGIAHFPEAGSLKDIDDIYSLPLSYGMVCCDISSPRIPGTGIMKFKRRTLRETLYWVFVGD
jgi:hypothetical protein